MVVTPCFPSVKDNRRRAAHEAGDGELDTTTLFAANMTILWVMAMALIVAGWGRRHEPWWESWVVANIVLGVALAVFTFERHLDPLLVATLPNGLLVLGMALRWRAAREFSGRVAPVSLVWGPFALFVLCAAPFAHGSYATVFTVVNVVLTVLAAAVAWEFWRDRADGLPSRYGLVAAYGAMAASFGWRILVGMFEAGSMPGHLPHDTALVVHLTVALFYTVASGAFSLSLAYERSNAELRHAASHDALTGLLNRGAFEEGLRVSLARAETKPFTLALFDIDHFKQVNDRYGHVAGDEALRRCAAICRAHVRQGDVVARVGGEEFAVILMDMDETAALAVIERIRNAVRAAVLSSGADSFHVTISGGVCHSSAAPGDFDALMHLVDTGLYEAKNKGRDRIEKMAA